MRNKVKDIKLTWLYIVEYFKNRGLLGFLKDVWTDLFLGRSAFNWVYLLILTSIPVGLQLYMGSIEDSLSFLTALTGVMCVIYVKEGRLSNYIIGLVNALIYLYLSWGTGFLGEAATAVFWVVMNIIGPFQWVNGYRKKEEMRKQGIEPVKQDFVSKKLDLKGHLKYLAFSLTIWFAFGMIYKHVAGWVSYPIERPFRDSITDGTNYAGQFLMNGQFADQWLYWNATNIFSIYLWWGKNPMMVAMYVAQLVNSIVGWTEWELQARGKTWSDILPFKKG